MSGAGAPTSCDGTWLCEMPASPRAKSRPAGVTAICLRNLKTVKKPLPEIALKIWPNSLPGTARYLHSAAVHTRGPPKARAETCSRGLMDGAGGRTRTRS